MNNHHRRSLLRFAVVGLLLAAVIATGCAGDTNTATSAAPTSATSTTPTVELPPAEPPVVISPEPPATAPPVTSPPATEPPVVAPGPSGPTAADVLATLEVKGRAPKTGYDRDQFGPAWADVDRNGCDTRNDILRRDLTNLTFDRDGCKVLTGTLADPYTGKIIAFQRGQSTSSAVQIDHVVALSDAWQKGAQQLDADTRRRFSNDPLNLLASDGPANQQKGDGDAATWLPSNRGYRCAYVARQVAVKARYGLWVTAAERDAIAGVLAGCPGEPLP